MDLHLSRCKNGIMDVLKTDNLPSLSFFSQFILTEPCEDSPTYEFSCPRWQAQGYCERRQNEMNVVCRKTCGFCGKMYNFIITFVFDGLF